MNLALMAAALVCSLTLTGGGAVASAQDATPLMQAAFEGDIAKAQQLLKQGADVNAINPYGVDAMQLAAEASNTALIQLLLKAGANANAANLDGETALHLVARSGNVEAAKLLLRARAKVDARENFGGQTPLMWAAARRHAPMVALLLSKGADINARSTVRDYQRVATAESRAKMLDRGGFTPLIYAARENCRECVDILLRRRADIDLADPAGVPPLSIAMMNGNWDIAKLIEAGADVNQWDIFGQSPLHVAVGNMDSRRSTNPLDIDLQNKTSGRDIVKLLVERGANPNQQLFYRFPTPGRDNFSVGRGFTPFLMACANGDIEIVKFLLAHGANPRLASADGQGPIILAVGSRAGGTGNPGVRSATAEAAGARSGDAATREDQTIPLIKLLAAAGADIRLIAKRHYLQRTRGGSALHYAVRTGNKAAIAALLELGVDVNAKDEDGLTPLDYAMGRGYVPFLQLPQAPRRDLADTLRAAGATIRLAQAPDWPPQGAPIGQVVYDAVIWPVEPVGP